MRLEVGEQHFDLFALFSRREVRGRRVIVLAISVRGLFAGDFVD